MWSLICISPKEHRSVMPHGHSSASHSPHPKKQRSEDSENIQLDLLTSPQSAGTWDNRWLCDMLCGNTTCILQHTTHMYSRGWICTCKRKLLEEHIFNSCTF